MPRLRLTANVRSRLKRIAISAILASSVHTAAQAAPPVYFFQSPGGGPPKMVIGKYVDCATSAVIDILDKSKSTKIVDFDFTFLPGKDSAWVVQVASGKRQVRDLTTLTDLISEYTPGQTEASMKASIRQKCGATPPEIAGARP